MAKQNYPRPWDWAKERAPLPLSQHIAAPAKIGFYEIGFLKNGKFEAKYAGRAKGVTLQQRLGQHFRHSHNELVRKYRNSAYYRCKVFATEELTAYVEAVSIAAYEYDWNRRNEWTQHWILET